MLKRKVSSTFKRKNTLDIQERIYPGGVWQILTAHLTFRERVARTYGVEVRGFL